MTRRRRPGLEATHLPMIGALRRGHGRRVQTFRLGHSPDHAGEHLAGNGAAVVPEGELAQMLGQVSLADVDVRAADTELEPRPEALNRVRVDAGPCVLAHTVPDIALVLASPRDQPVVPPFVGVDGAAAFDVLVNQRLDRRGLGVRDHKRLDRSAALLHAEHDGLVASAASSGARSVTAGVGLINLDLAEQHFNIHVSHEMANPVGHAPRALVGDAELPFEFLRRDAVRRAGE